MPYIDLLLDNHRLTTAEIFYFMPAHPLLIQTYLWQDFDVAPAFPILHRFLNFWERELEGKLHSVTVTSCELIKPTELFYAKNELTVQ